MQLLPLKNDTEHFYDALQQWRADFPDRAHVPLGEMELSELSEIIMRAQALNENAPARMIEFTYIKNGGKKRVANTK